MKKRHHHLIYSGFGKQIGKINLKNIFVLTQRIQNQLPHSQNKKVVALCSKSMAMEVKETNKHADGEAMSMKCKKDNEHANYVEEKTISHCYLLITIAFFSRINVLGKLII